MANPTSSGDMAHGLVAHGLAAHSHACLLVFEIAGFGGPGRGDEVLIELHKGIYAILERAFTDAGIPWRNCFHQDRGDGALVIPASTAVTGDVLDSLIAGLRAGLRRHNRSAGGHAKMALRMAATTGPVRFDAYGVIGHGVTRLFSLFNAEDFRRRFTDRTELGIIASGDLRPGPCPDGTDTRHGAVQAPVPGPERVWTYFADQDGPVRSMSAEPRQAGWTDSPRQAGGAVVVDMAAFRESRRSRH